MKKTWDIINETINKKRITQVQDKFKLPNGEFTDDKIAISDKFNNFLVNIGPQLAAKIENKLGCQPVILQTNN